VSRVLAAPTIAIREQSILPHVLIIGEGLSNFAAAKALVSRGYHVEIIASQEIKINPTKQEEKNQQTLEELRKLNVIIKPLPDDFKLSGSPGNYEATLKYSSETTSTATGAVLVDVHGVTKKTLSWLKEVPFSGLLGRIISKANNSDFLISPDINLLHGTTINETAGIFLLPTISSESSEDHVIRGLAAAARVCTYLEQAKTRPRDLAVDIDSKLCRGCGDCASICSFIEMRKSENGTVSAFIDKALCLGCGACTTYCPTGAITQPLQSDKQISATLCSILSSKQTLSEVNS